MDTPDPEKEFALEKEVRFALVMYGGVSLAVYINGVAQEFYSLVRATSGAGGAARSGTEAVYRKLGAILGANGADLEQENVANAPIRTRFVVDILSGTSAGGLNSVFLAKALAKGLDFGVLEKLWVDQADIATLMNDRGATAAVPGGFTLRQQKPPQSLLSSERMYALLLSALGEMDSQPAEDPLVREVDLFITATDLRGLETRLKLADDVVLEKRHRNVFHFCASPYLIPATPVPPAMAAAQDSAPAAPQAIAPQAIAPQAIAPQAIAPQPIAPPAAPDRAPAAAPAPDTKEPPTRNDFDQKFNPFLAFAGRCTAAFPIAFEPMRLADIDPVLDRCTPLKNDAGSRANSAAWRQFIVDYIPEDEDSPPESSGVPYRFRNRAFADGGYLNNKPFSYAIEELGVRGGELPYDRKLVYIEPSPESADEQGSDAAKPDAIQNAFDAAFALPRYQTIREDLRHVVERNRLVERIQDVIDQLQQTVAQSDLLTTFQRESAAEFAAQKLTDLGASRGPLYAGYHRLKIKTVTDELSRKIGAALDLDESSDELHALHFVMRAWVQNNYRQEDTDPLKTESRFLLQYDLPYRERRLYFLLSRLDALYSGDENGRTIAQSTGVQDLLTGLTAPQEQEWKLAIRSLRGNRAARPSPADAAAQAKTAKPCPAHGEACPVHGQGLVPILGFLRRERNELRQRGTLNPLAAAGPDRGKWQKWLGSILAGTDEECAEKAKNLFDSTPPELVPLRTQIEAMLGLADRALKDTFVCSAWHVDELLGVTPPLPPAFDAPSVLNYCVRKQYDTYDFYDAVSFPILYGSDTGTLKQTAVHRISPRDATSLIDEATDSKNRTKLAGDSLGAFGAFFQKSWRKNDMMWGRLDGAERIIGTLLPGSDKPTERLRQRLVHEAQGRILTECLRAEDVEKLLSAVVGSVAEAPAGETEASLAQRALQQADRAARIHALVGPDALVDYVRESYAIDKTYRPEWALPIAARAANVAGQLLEFLSGERKWRAGPVLWVVRATRLFWGVVEVAIPQSFSHATFGYILNIYLMAAFLVLVTGFFLGQPALTAAAWKMLLAGGAVWVVVELLNQAMSGRDAAWRVVRLALIALVAALILGGLTIGMYDAPFWIGYFRLHVLRSGPGTADLLRWLGIASGATVLTGVAASLPGFSDRSRNAAAGTPFARPALAMELGRRPRMVKSILATQGDRRSMRLVQYLDFALIPSYILFFVAAAALELRAWAVPVWTAAGAAVAGLAAAVFDVLEDRGILRTLDLPANAIQYAHLRRTRNFALRKWALLAIAELLLGAGALLAVAPARVAPWFGGVLGVAGMAGLLGCKWPKLLALSLLGLGLVLLACLLLALGIKSA